MSARKKPLRWRRTQRARFTARDSYQLHQGDEHIATVAECYGGWYWYGMVDDLRINTAGNPTTLVAAKDAATLAAKGRQS